MDSTSTLGGWGNRLDVCLLMIHGQTITIAGLLLFLHKLFDKQQPYNINKLKPVQFKVMTHKDCHFTFLWALTLAHCLHYGL